MSSTIMTACACFRHPVASPAASASGFSLRLKPVTKYRAGVDECVVFLLAN
jgi:hypothetical protein